MNNAPAILRSLITFALIIPLAVVVGYMLTNPLQYSTLAIFGVLALALIFPLLMKWHYPLMLFCWNTSAVAFFVKGAPAFSLVMITLSLGISVAERMLSQEKQFIRVPQITWPLLFLIAVVLFTAKMTGGFGLRAFGSEVYGGKKYVFLIIGILSYFAVTARPIPPGKAKWYIALFFLGGTTMLVGDLYPITPSFLHFVFWIIPPSGLSYEGNNSIELGVTRLGGVGAAGIAFCLWMMARYGIQGIFLGGKWWRWCLWIVSFLLVFLGGFRSGIFAVGATFLVMFFMEGMHRTKLLLVAILSGIVTITAIIPLAPHLPFTFQRALAFLPLNISQEARTSAEDSTNWRMEMWKALMPQVSQHLLVGKGYAITAEDFQMMGYDSSFHAVDPSQQGLALASDYHNGVLSVLIPFGIWGLAAYVWLMLAGLWVLYNNWKHGDPALRTVNTLLLATCLLEFVLFASCMAGLFFSYGCGYWAGHVGLSVALNNGVCKPAPRESDQAKQARNLVRPFPRPRPAFQRYRTGL